MSLACARLHPYCISYRVRACARRTSRQSCRQQISFPVGDGFHHVGVDIVHHVPLRHQAGRARGAFVALAIVAALSCNRSASPTHAAATQQNPDSGTGTPRARIGGNSDAPAPDRAPTDCVDAGDYEGVDSRGIPHRATSVLLSRADADVLRRAYGIEDFHRLYVSDSTEEDLLKYDTQVKRCGTCYVNSYRVGYVSVRKREESWEAAERHVRGTPARVFTRTPAGEAFRILDYVDRSWDWPHVELPSSSIGSRTIEEAVARGRACLAPGATQPCNFPPHLPASLGHPLVR